MFAFPETKLRKSKEISVIKPNTVHQLRLLHFSSEISLFHIETVHKFNYVQ